MSHNSLDPGSPPTPGSGRASGPDFPLIFGPTFSEMAAPETAPAEFRRRAAAEKDPLDPANLFNITWKDPTGRVRYVLLDRALTGVEANIILICGAAFPTGSHKVGAAYAVTMERQLAGDIAPGRHTLVWPSTGNYGISGAWVGPRLGYKSVAIVPERVSRERFEIIAAYGARYIKTPGREASVKEVFEACRELSRTDPDFRVLNQFQDMANYRFHYAVTAPAAVEAAAAIGNGRVAAFVSAMGSGGTIAAGDRLKQVFSECRIVGLEPVQCPTLFANGYGDHDIQGTGDKHVTWIHNVMNMDALMCVDDLECKKGLRLLTDPSVRDYLTDVEGIDAGQLTGLAGLLGVSAVCNILGAVKTAKFYGLGARDNIVTVATDSANRYGSVLAAMAEEWGPLTREAAAADFAGVFRGVKLDYIQEGSRENRLRWHNLKYFWWVEQHGRTVADLDALRSQDFWGAEQAKVAQFDRALRQARDQSGRAT
jgi:cysteine synthase A